MLRALNLQKSYGAHTVLRGVTLTVSRVDRIGLVGANGAGKSTLLRLLAGESLDAGAVRTDPQVRVGFLPQELPECRGTLWEAAMDGAVEILSLTSRWRALADAMSRAPDDRALHDEYAAMQEALERADGFTLELRVRRTLRGLGLPEPLWNSPVRALSGGERTRLNLARTLIAVPDLLLLDEPTNHLDLSAIEWLETFLAGFRGAVVVASHDRRLLNAVARRILQLEDGVGREYRGNYDAYRAARLGELAAQAEAYNRYRQEVERIREFTRRQLGRAAAVQKGPKRGSDHRGRVARKMAKRAQAARSRLERMEAAAPGRPRGPDRIELSLAAPGRLGPMVANARGLTKTFGDRVLFAGVNLTLGREDRVGVVGPNGAGKTTLLRLLVGYDKPTSGEVTLGPNVRAAMLSQNHDVPQDTRRVLDVAMDLGFALPEARALLAALLFRGDRVFQRICDLSIGETTRLRLLELLANETNLLVLDEPTNHLDLESRERLEEALDPYAGTLVIASHDRFLLDRFCTTTWSIESGGVHVFEGNYTASRADGRIEARGRGHGDDESGR